LTCDKKPFYSNKKLDMFQQTPGHTSQKFWNAPATTFDQSYQQPQQQPGWWVHSSAQPTHVRPVANELIFPRASPANRIDANFQDGCSFDNASGSERFRERPIPSLKTRPLNRPKSPPKQRPEDQWQINVDTGRPIKLGGRVHKRITKRKTVAGGEGGESQKSHDQKREENSGSPGNAFKEPNSKKVMPTARKDKKIQVDSWSLDLETSDPTSTFKY
jgi:hypothetical protein